MDYKCVLGKLAFFIHEITTAKPIRFLWYNEQCLGAVNCKPFLEAGVCKPGTGLQAQKSEA